MICFWAGIMMAACGAVWAAWPTADVDSGYFPLIRRQAYGRRGPRVLFDEAHWNARLATGAFRPFVRMLERDGYRVARNHQEFVPGLLAGYQVLVVVNARPAPWGGETFTQAEIQAVRGWVAQGGSLLVAGAGAQDLAGAECGKGRVAAVYDPWILTARIIARRRVGINTAENQQAVLDLMHWLSRLL